MDSTLEAQWEAGVAAAEAARAAARAAGSIKWLEDKLKKYEAMQGCATDLHELLEDRWHKIRTTGLTQEQRDASLEEALTAALAAPGAAYVEEVAADFEAGDDVEEAEDESDDEDV